MNQFHFAGALGFKHSFLEYCTNAEYCMESEKQKLTDMTYNI